MWKPSLIILLFSAIICASSVKLPRAISGPGSYQTKPKGYANRQNVMPNAGPVPKSNIVQPSRPVSKSSSNGTVPTSNSDLGVDSSSNGKVPTSNSDLGVDSVDQVDASDALSSNISIASNVSSSVPDDNEQQQQQLLQAVNCDGPPPPCNLAGRKDFNPALAASANDSSQPGIKARLNPAAFRYMSRELVGILNYQIKRAKLSSISQCLPQADGCLRIEHLHVNNYKCSKDVSFKPAQPNRLVMDVRNIDVSVNGDLGGQITIMHALALFGQVQVTAQKVKVIVGVVVENSATTGSPKLRVVSCTGRVGNVQTSIQSGGLLGDIANQQLKHKINKIVQRQVTSQLCKRVPQMVEEQVNPQISGVVPKKIAFKSIAQVALNSSCLAALTESGGTTTTKATTTLTTTTESSSSNGTTLSASETATTKAPGKKAPSPISLIMQLMDMKKLDNLFLNSQLLGSAATSNDYTIKLRGDFSVCGWGCTPFSPFPAQIPACIGKNCKMADIMLSDYTINTMLYHMHRVGFFVVKIGPDTPAVGRLMRLTCESGDDDEVSLDDHGVEDENGTLIVKRSPISRRTKRQDEDEDLVQTLIDTGICIRSLLPAAADEYPDEKVDLVMRTMRAPSATIYENGTIILEQIAKLEFFGHTNKKKLGTFKSTSTAQIDVNSEGEIIKANLTLPSLTLTDIGTDVKSGMTQEGLDTLTSLMKEKVPESANKKLAKGCKLDFPPGVGGLPIRVLNPEVHFVPRAVHIKSNFELYSADGSSPLGASEPCE
ncbi:hypothetical protein GPALN_010880 [Globodera pallida]|nr:hypothetical protein GPALN_010880 [Globodera pallida]